MKITKARQIVRDFLSAEGIMFPQYASDEWIATLSENVLEIGQPRKGESYSTDTGRVQRVAKALTTKTITKASEAERHRIKDFYQSPEWRRARYDALRKNDGRCELCGKSKHNGIMLNVDHIKCLRDNWKLRLDGRNLQVLCGPCNHGKGNRDDTDWRQP